MGLESRPGGISVCGLPGTVPNLGVRLIPCEKIGKIRSVFLRVVEVPLSSPEMPHSLGKGDRLYHHASICHGIRPRAKQA